MGCYCHIRMLILITTLTTSGSVPAKCEKEEEFKVEYQWTFINFTWESEETYQNAIRTKRYIPENNVFSGMKFYNDTFYVSLPKLCSGTPVTLAYFSTMNTHPKTGPLLTPFPDWKTNDENNPSCKRLVNVQSIEIDTNGILWVLDATRLKPSKCPPKLVLYDLNSKGKVVFNYIFPNKVALHLGAYLNDLVIDDSDGTFAYIPDTNFIDPGLVIFSLAQNRAWKIRDVSMLPEISASNLVVDGTVVPIPFPIDGIALSPKSSSGPRYVYYAALTSLKMYSISTEVLKNETGLSDGQWRRKIKYVGKKQAQGDGMIMDNTGTLYYGLLPLDAVGRWNTSESLKRAEIMDQNNRTLHWPDAFCFDDKGNICVNADNIEKLITTLCYAFQSPQNKVRFRILKYCTGTRSYLYRNH